MTGVNVWKCSCPSLMAPLSPATAATLGIDYRAAFVMCEMKSTERHVALQNVAVRPTLRGRVMIAPLAALAALAPGSALNVLPVRGENGQLMGRRTRFRF